MLYHHMPNYLS